MVALPADTPVTTPPLVIVATVTSLLIHDMPPDVASLRVVLEPAHTVVLPVIAEGLAFTVNDIVR
jgi:hypothetical protein